MLVGDRMTKRPITITEDTGIDKALELMHSEKVRRLPVLNKRGQLVGIVSELDLLKASPSPATSLSIYELPYLLSKIKMHDIMTRDVVTATEERSQARNREIAFERLLVKLRRLARRRRRRVATRKPKAVRTRELEDKRQTAEKKRLRARVREPED